MWVSTTERLFCLWKTKLDEEIIRQVSSRYDVFHDSYVTGFACEKDNTEIQITLSNIYRFNEAGAEEYFPEGVVLLKFDQVQILEREGVIEARCSVPAFDGSDLG